MGRCFSIFGWDASLPMGRSMTTVFNQNYLSGKRILVTGGSSGIGRQAALRMAGCGARICLSGRDATRLNEIVSLLPGQGHNSLPLDLTSTEDVADRFQGESRRNGSFFGIFHAAGVSFVRPVKLWKPIHYSDVFGPTVLSGFALARAASLQDVMVNGGALVFMSSVASVRGQVGMSVYSGAKGAIDGMTRSLAVEFCPRRIRVNSICAGAVETPMHDRLLRTLNEDSVETYRSKHLLGFGKADDIANMVTFIIGDGGGWITGTNIVVDGGYTVR